MSLDLSKLFNIKRLPDGALNAGCPACMAVGHDSNQNHLWIHKGGAFRCAKDQSSDHYKAIYRGAATDGDSRHESYEYFDPQPKLTVEKIYPEDSIAKLVPEYAYWIDRGVREEVLRSIEGGIATDDERGKLSGRYVFPLRNMRNQLIAFAGRLVVENSFAPKWKIIGKKSHVVFPSCHPDTDTMILVEGIGCALALLGADVQNVVTLFGLNISGEQIAYLISRSIRRIVIATNNEESGIGNAAAEDLKNRLSRFFNEDDVVIRLPPRKDFLECSSEELAGYKAAL